MADDEMLLCLGRRVRALRESDAFFLQFLNIFLRVLLELLDAGGAAEINPVALVVGIDVLVDVPAAHRACSLIFRQRDTGKNQ